MREIKFRGKSVRTGNWVYGFPVYESGGPFIGKIATWWESGDERNYEEIEIDPKTIGQFTSLKDKNGKDIFEGDILDFPEILYSKPPQKDTTKNMAVEWCNDGMEYICVNKSDHVPLYMAKTSYQVEVIGTVYENPELLKHPGQKNEAKPLL